MLEALAHPVVLVRDLNAAIATYASLLGQPPPRRQELPEHGVSCALFALANTQLKLLAPMGEDAALRKRLDEGGEGLLALIFTTPDADAFAKRLRERKVEANVLSSPAGRYIPLPRSEARGVSLAALEGRPPAAPVGDAGVEALDHVVVMSPDLESSRHLYADILGLRLALERTFEKRGTRILFFRVGGVTVEVAASLSESACPSKPDRLWGLAYRVRDLEATSARLLAADFDVTEIRKGAKRGTRVCTVRRETHGVATLLISAEAPRAQTSAL